MFTAAAATQPGRAERTMNYKSITSAAAAAAFTTTIIIIIITG